MKRYFNDGEFNFEEDDEDGDEVFEEDKNYIDINSDDVVDAMKLDLVEIHLNQKVLEKAIEIAKSDWLWVFRSPSKKTKIINKIYHKLIEMVGD